MARSKRSDTYERLKSRVQTKSASMHESCCCMVQGSQKRPALPGAGPKPAKKRLKKVHSSLLICVQKGILEHALLYLLP